MVVAVVITLKVGLDSPGTCHTAVGHVPTRPISERTTYSNLAISEATVD